MRNALLTAITLTLVACPADDADKGTSLSAGPDAEGETGPAEVPPAPAPAAGEPGTPPALECEEQLTACESALKICKGAK